MAQALAAGLTRDEVRRRVRAGHWQALFRGVYATFGGAVPREAVRWAAVLAAGKDAMLSHYTAAELVGLVPVPGAGGEGVPGPGVPGLVVPGLVVPGLVVPGLDVPGSAATRSVAAGSAVPGSVASGPSMPGAGPVASGLAAAEPHVSGSVAPGSAASGRLVPGSGPVASGWIAAGPLVPGAVAAGPSVPGSAEAGSVASGSVAVGPLASGSAAAGPSVPGSAAGPVAGPVASGSAAPGSGDPGLIAPEPLVSGAVASSSFAPGAIAPGLGDPGLSALVHVTVPSQRRIVPAAGVVVHLSSRAVQARHPRRRPPQTRVEETVLDLATDAESPDDAVAWVAAACGRALTTPARVAKALGARDRFRWRHIVEAALREADLGVSSLLEHHYRVTVERPHGLPRRTHRSPPASGDEAVDYPDFGVRVVLRWAAVRDRPCVLAARVAAALRRGGWHCMPARCDRPGCAVLDP